MVPPAIQEMQVQPLGQEDPLEKGMATHPSILAWRIPWTEESRGKELDTTERLTLLLFVFHLEPERWVETLRCVSLSSSHNCLPRVHTSQCKNFLALSLVWPFAKP